MNKSTVFIYSIATLAIVGWWYLAFTASVPFDEGTQQISNPPKKPHPLLAHLSPLDRDTLTKALTGDFALMSRLIADWDVDAQILSSQGLPGIQRLPRKTFLKSQVLGRKLANTSSEKNQLKFLPQTYAAACFLLALVEPEQIVALPSGLRKHTHIYPDSILARIPLDVDRYNAEKLFLARPDIAFISSHYSHPSAIQALQSQGIKIHDTGSLISLENILDALQSIGEVTQRKKETSLLNLFIQASLQAIKNRLAVQKTGKTLLASKILYLNYHDKFYLPSNETFASEILARLEIPHYPFPRSSMPLEKENLFVLNPDCLIVSSTNGEALKKQMESDPALKTLSAIKQGRVFFVDDSIQQSPTQFVVLAYYDLAQVIAQAYLP